MNGSSPRPAPIVPAIVWTDSDGSLRHVHPCQLQPEVAIAECPAFVRTGCRTAVGIARCPHDGSVIDIFNGDGTPHKCEVAS